MLKIKIDTLPKQVTKDTLRKGIVCKGIEKYINELEESIFNEGRKGAENTYMNKLKESIFNEAKEGAENNYNSRNDATDPTTSAITSNTDTSTWSSDTYNYGVGAVAKLATEASVFFIFKKKSCEAANKEQVNKEQQQPIKPPN